MFKALSRPVLTRLSAGAQAGWLHVPWAGPVLETSRQELGCGHWCWKRSGCLQSTKAFPTPQRVPVLSGQTDGLTAGTGAPRWQLWALTPGHHAFLLWRCLPGEGGSAGVKDHLEVKTPKKCHNKSKSFQCGNSEAPLFSSALSRPDCFPAFPPTHRTKRAKAQACWK